MIRALVKYAAAAIAVLAIANLLERLIEAAKKLLSRLLAAI